jgi:hypothetical protein
MCFVWLVRQHERFMGGTLLVPPYRCFTSEGTRRILINFGIRRLEININVKAPVLSSSML